VSDVDPWTVGLVVVIVVGLAVIVYGALHDRALNKRRAAEMLSAPSRPIPRFAPDRPAPHYLSELQARRPPPDAAATDLTPSEREQIKASQDDPTTVTVKAGYLAAEFITDAGSGWAVLDRPIIMVCDEPVQTVRELLPVLERLVLSKSPLVIAAPAFTDEVEATLAVNKIRLTMRLLPIRASAEQLVSIAEATGADRLLRSDLQAGFVLPQHLGRAGRWVSSRSQSFIIGPAGRTTA
jgi:hypothetical protein